ncbi:MAG TPA: M24 family metallopeptidase, partial [Verrucomicrobiae bacterium]|nr:M24 family metallopeptidase [Verrucomicrobiae bacterium]
MIVLKSPSEIERMRRASRIVASVLQRLRGEIQPGVSTVELDRIAEAEAVAAGAKPAFKGYGGYRHALCCSVNSEVVHGIPGSRKLVEGDIVSIDFGVILDGFHGDAAITLPVGA